jgi:hypothetical protein
VGAVGQLAKGLRGNCTAPWRRQLAEQYPECGVGAAAGSGARHSPVEGACGRWRLGIAPASHQHVGTSGAWLQRQQKQGGHEAPGQMPITSHDVADCGRGGAGAATTCACKTSEMPAARRWQQRSIPFDSAGHALGVQFIA